jgi:transposase
MGRSRGGLTRKIHAVVYANGLPITPKFTPDQAHDGKSADDRPATVKARDTLIADAGYDSDRLRVDLERRRVKACIKPAPNRKKTYRPRKATHAKSNLVERFSNRLKPHRAIANRFEKHAAHYLVLVQRASARLWMRFMGR